MQEWLEALPEIWKLLGFSGVLLFLIAMMVRWYVLQMLNQRREEKADRLRIIAALDACHKEREESARSSKQETVRLVQALERNSVAFSSNTASNKSLEAACVQIVASLRDRPCFDTTPPGGHRTPLPRIGHT